MRSRMFERKWLNVRAIEWVRYTSILFRVRAVIPDGSIRMKFSRARSVTHDEVVPSTVCHSWWSCFICDQLLMTRNFAYNSSPLKLFYLRPAIPDKVLPFTVCYSRQSHFVHNMSLLRRLGLLYWRSWGDRSWTDLAMVKHFQRTLS